jgi:phage-related protein
MGSEAGCQLLEFLGDLKDSDPDELGRITALLDRTADHGPPRNEEKCRFFRDLQVFELKTRGGVRVMAFWDQDRLIVCSHGFMKKSQKTPKGELDRVEKAQRDYRDAKRLNRLLFA